MRKVFIPCYDYTVGHMFKTFGWEITTEESEADLICFTGGEDVSPTLYLHAHHHSTYSNHQRDTAECAVFHRAKEKKTPMIGICRGGQLLNVLEGGTMYQDVTNHTGSHEAIIDGEKLWVTSTHHQMMNPASNAIIIGVGVGTGASRTYWSGKDKCFITDGPKAGQLDIEVLVYGTTVCFQPHPEYSNNKPEYRPLAEKFFQLIDKYCFAKKGI